MDLLKDLKITKALAYASGTATREGAILDMSGYEGVLMIVTCATLASSAVGDIHAEQDSAVGGGTMADLLGTAIAIADDDDDQIFVLDICKPLERYVRVVVTKNGANAQAESAIYIQYGPGNKPQVNTVADLVTVETHISPIEGTK
jgi:hypothetical protein